MPLYLNDGKLLLNGSQLASSRSCCCEEEGDDCETCADFCLYGIDIVSPVALSATSDACEQIRTVIVFSTADFPPCNDGAQCCGGSLAPPPGAPVDNSNVYPVYSALTDIFGGRSNASVGFANNLGATCGAKVQLSCLFPPSTGQTTPNQEPTFYLDVFLYFYVPSPSHPNSFPNRLLEKFARVELPSSCQRNRGALCGVEEPANVRTKKYLNVPVEFTVTNASPGFGTWTVTLDESNGSQARNQPCFDSMLANFSATFRIAKRDSCQAADQACADDPCPEGKVCCEYQYAEGQFCSLCHEPVVPGCIECSGCPTFDSFLGQLNVPSTGGPFANFNDALGYYLALDPNGECNSGILSCDAGFYTLVCCPGNVSSINPWPHPACQ